MWKRCVHEVKGQFNPTRTGVERTSNKDKDETDVLRTVYERTGAIIRDIVTIQKYNTKFVKRHVAVASEALANRTVKKHRRTRTNVLQV